MCSIYNLYETIAYLTVLPSSSINQAALLTIHTQWHHTINTLQELFPPNYESSEDDSSGDEGYTQAVVDEQWRLGDTAPEDGEFAELSDLWDDTLNESKGQSKRR